MTIIIVILCFRKRSFALKYLKRLFAFSSIPVNTHKLILNNGRGFPDIATIIFFSEKFVFLRRQQSQPVPIRSMVWEQLTQLGGGLRESMRRVLREHDEGFESA